MSAENSGGHRPPLQPRKTHVLFRRDNPRLDRELIEEAQALKVLLVQSIVDVLSEVNLHLMRLETVLRREFFGNFVDAGQAEIPGIFKIFAKPRQFRARAPRPERKDERQASEFLPLRRQVVDLGYLAVIGQGWIANDQRRVRAL